MIATHSVKINGTWYKAGAEIPAFTDKPSEAKEEPIEVTTFPVETSAEEPKRYTKRDITFMKVDDLRKLASDLGINGAEELTGTALKPIIIEKLGL